MESFLDKSTKLSETWQPRGRVELEYKAVPVAIENKSRPTVTLAVDTSPTGSIPIEGSFAAAQGGLETRFPPRSIQGHWCTGMQHPYRTRRIGIVKPDREKPIPLVIQDRDFTHGSGTILFPDAIGEDPRVDLADSSLSRPSDVQPQPRETPHGLGRATPAACAAALGSGSGAFSCLRHA